MSEAAPLGERCSPALSEQVNNVHRRWITRLFGWLIVAGLVWLAARRIDFGTLAAALRGARFAPLALAVLCNVIANTLARVRRWQALLRPLPNAQPASFFDLARLLLAGYAFSNLLPARAGEAVRVVELRRRRGYPASGLVAVQLAEKAIETLSLGLVCGILSLTAGPGRAPLALGGALAVCGLVLLLALPRRVPAVATGFLGGLRAVHARRSWVRSLCWSLLSDTTDLVLVALCLRAFGIEVPPSAWALVLFSVNLAILLPSTPGQVGVLEAGGVVALTMAGVPPAPALAFALAYHAVHLVPTTLLGVAGLCLPWRRS
ncbi:MAG: lysylphosphatidylglycerol synthase transmembrane domain-containing protein [Myxococcales bacterium]|nr:flippase-like domain-containing protein [Myxococcales bacterium]